MDLMRQERMALAVLAMAGLAGLGLIAWQRQHTPLVIQGAPSAAQAGAWDARLAAARQIDINTATEAQLERLPGIGPVLAAKIVEDRRSRGPFGRPEDLARVPGIGPHTYETLQDAITVK